MRNLRRCEEALTFYDKALALKPDITDAWLGRGIVFYEINLTDKAISDFQRAVEINPGSIEARSAACVAELPILVSSTRMKLFCVARLIKKNYWQFALTLKLEGCKATLSKRLNLDSHSNSPIKATTIVISKHFMAHWFAA